ncbi:MAG TPA: hypothetical protein VLF68_02840 [Candidatus Saccharimonadales bacterium]|nr:hypothetical protein [Candidatus Saccharimonadales bacterium]
MKNKKVFVCFGLLILLKILFSVFGVNTVFSLFGNSKLVEQTAFLPLRLSAAFVFLWYALSHLSSGLEFNGIGNKMLQKLGIPKQVDFTLFAKVWGFMEILICCSLIFGVYIDLFSALASLYLLIIILVYYIAANTFIFRDVAIWGAVTSLFLLAK